MMLPKCVQAGTCLLLQAAGQLSPRQVPLGGVEGIGKCVEALLEAKRTANRTERYLKSLGYYLRQFAKGREERALADFTVEEVEAWLAKYPGQYSRQTWLARLSTLFAFAVRRGFIGSNPCDRLDRVTVDVPPPAVFKPAEAERLLAWCPTVMRPYLVLGMFAGVRPEEVERMDWGQIDLAGATVRVEGKTRRRRLVPLHPRAVAELRKHPLQAGDVAPSGSTIARWRASAVKVLRWERWPQDVLRHTAASYLLALHGDAGKVATMLGNSSSILLSHYHQPVKAADCAEFWALPAATPCPAGNLHG